MFSKATDINTPATIIDKEALADDVKYIKYICDKVDCRLLFAMKSQSLKPALDVIAKYCDGLATSSLYEAQLARETVGTDGTVHFTSPGLRADEISQILEISDYTVLNSLGQWDQFSEKLSKGTRCGLRINPHKSFIEDGRYDPCKKFSKLGASITNVIQAFEETPKKFEQLNGIHIHTNCESTDFSQLDSTVSILEENVPAMLEHVEWINLGGGYLFQESENHDPFLRAAERLKEKFDVKVMIEPGATISRESISIISKVIDLFECDGKQIAILDTTVNHMPDIFEYNYRPDILGDKKNGKHSYVLAGGTCLAGDTFGEFSFDTPLSLGSQVVFLYIGAYNHVKSHMFNGINLPDIYTYTKEEGYKHYKSFSYNDYRNFFGAEK